MDPILKAARDHSARTAGYGPRMANRGVRTELLSKRVTQVRRRYQS